MSRKRDKGSKECIRFFLARSCVMVWNPDIFTYVDDGLCDDPKLPRVKAGEIIFGIQHKYNKTEHRYNIAKEIHRVITL